MYVKSKSTLSQSVSDSVSDSVSESVTRSPIELFWTAKKTHHWKAKDIFFYTETLSNPKRVLPYIRSKLARTVQRFIKSGLFADQMRSTFS